MAINLTAATQSVGRVVLVRTNTEVFIDTLVRVNPTGGILSFQKWPALLMQNIDSLRPLHLRDAAQVLADENAHRGDPHDEPSLTPSAGILVALFPSELTTSNANTDEEQALKLLLACVPSGSEMDLS